MNTGAIITLSVVAVVLLAVIATGVVRLIKVVRLELDEERRMNEYIRKIQDGRKEGRQVL